jgi:tetratricopeptide (TPR) repeat protein
MRKLTRLICLAAAAAAVAMTGVGCSRTPDKAGYLERAEKYFAAGDYDKAEAEYLNVLRLESQNPQAVNRLGFIWFEEGRLDRALPLLVKSRQLQPDNLEVRKTIGLTLLALGKAREAHDEAASVLQKNPQDDDALILLAESAATDKAVEETRQQLRGLSSSSGERAAVQVALGDLCFQQRDFQGAEAAFKRALALDPKLSAAHASLGTFYWSQKNIPLAEPSLRAASELSPLRSPRRLQYARFKIQNGDLQAGKRLLDEIVQKAPDYLPAWSLLAEIAFEEKRYDDCGALIKKILARDAANYDALILNGRLKLMEGDAGKAVAEFERLAALYPKAAYVHYQLALACLANGEASKARSQLGQAVMLNPDFTEAVLLLAELKLRAGDLSSAIIALRQLIQRQPQTAQAWLLLADAYRAQDDLDDALKIYQRYEAMFPRDPKVSVQMGLVYFQQGKRDEARKALESALAQSPGFMPALDQLVALDVVEKRYAAALDRVAREVEKHPQQAELRFLLAKVYLVQPDAPQAVAALRKVTELQPDFQPAYLLLAQLYLKSNQGEQAVQELSAAVARNPRDTAALMTLGMIYDQEKNYSAARDAYEKLLAVNPKFGPALNNLAYLYSEHLGQLDKAHELAVKAREAQPADVFTADTLAWILYKKGQYAKASGLLRGAAEKLPAEPEVQFHLGMAQYMMGEEEAARTALQRALQSNRDFPGRNEAGECLAILTLNSRNTGAETRAVLEKRLAAKPDDPVAQVRLAGILARTGSPEQAVAACQAVLRTNPKNVKAMMVLAELYAKRPADVTKAFDMAKAAYDLAPDDPDIAGTLGRMAYRVGNYKWAVSLLRQAILRQPGNPELLFDYAEAAYSMGLVAVAEAATQRALQTSAAFSRADEARGFQGLLALASNPAQALAAEAAVAQILKAAPNYAPALMAEATICEQKSDLNTAKQLYEQILGRFADFTPAKRRLAILGAEDPGDNQRIYDMALAAREVYPEDAEMAKALGIILYNRNLDSAAENLLKESAGKRSQDAVVMFYLGMTQYRLKHAAAAKLSLQRALELNLSGAHADEARKIVAEIK